MPDREHSSGGTPSRRVSLNEVLRLSRRVFLARGAGPGCEHEPAEAVAWLETRGLPGLVTLRADGEARGLQTGPWTCEESRGPEGLHLSVQGNGVSGAWVAASVVDWLVSAGPRASVGLESVRSALWFVPDLMTRLPDCRLMARDLAGDVRLATGGVDGNGLVFWCEPETLAGRIAHVSLEAGARAAGVRAHAAAPRVLLEERELVARYAASLDAGIPVPESLWQALSVEARGALVPESEASRLRGAGAERP